MDQVPIVCEAVRRDVLAHGRHHDSVAERHSADRERAKEVDLGHRPIVALVAAWQPWTMGFWVWSVISRSPRVRCCPKWDVAQRPGDEESISTGKRGDVIFAGPRALPPTQPTGISSIGRKVGRDGRLPPTHRKSWRRASSFMRARRKGLPCREAGAAAGSEISTASMIAPAGA